VAWIQLVTLLAVAQFFWFGSLVAKARVRYGVPAPATSGHEVFERYHRVHMNTLETLVLFLPSLWIAAQYWSPYWMAGLGAIYLIGRVVYLYGYVAEPKQRHSGYAISIAPTLILLLIGLYGAVGTLLT
jgi:uncharacterized membrane protein YecN with MAPEG domain